MKKNAGTKKSWIYELKLPKIVTRQHVKGIPQTLEALKGHLDFLKSFGKAGKKEVPQPPNLLFYGAPGAGKTFLACLLATESGAKFVPALEAPYTKWNADSIEKVFDDCCHWVNKNKKSLILFWDEFDAIAKKKNRQNISVMEATMVSQLLSQLDGHMEKTPGLVVIGATNNIDEIEPSIYRAGRLKTVPFDELDEEGMLFILKELAKDAGLPESFDYQTVAEMLSGETASMAAQIINRTCFPSALGSKTGPITEEDFFQAVVEEKVGFKTNKILTAREKKMVVIHEIGHGLVSTLLGHPAQMLILSPRKDKKESWGNTLARITRGILSKKDLDDHIAMLYGGIIAEEVCDIEGSAGAGADLEEAGSLAAWWVDSFMRKQSVGRANLIGITDAHHDSWGLHPLPTESLRRESEKLIKKLLDAAEKMAFSALKKVGKKKILTLAHLLENQDIIPRNTFLKYCKKVGIKFPSK